MSLKILELNVVIFLQMFVSSCMCSFIPVDYCKLCNCSTIESGCAMAAESDNTTIDFSCKEAQHILCRFPASHNVFPCDPFNFAANSEEQDAMDLFNGWRNKTAMGEWPGLPPAADMMRLEWDEELEFLANRVLGRCGHWNTSFFVDYCHDSPRFPVGAYRSHGKKHYLEAMMKETMDWEEPHIDKSLLTVSCEHVNKFFPGMFFQKAIWATSRFIGCARGDALNFVRLRYTLLCYFGPSGNGSWLYQVLPGQKVYTEGPPQSACPPDSHKDPMYAGLCRHNDYRDKPPGYRPPRGERLLPDAPFLLYLLLLPFLIYMAQLMRARRD